MAGEVVVGEVTDLDMAGWIIRHFEGGFVNHPDDAGGATKYGVTLATLASWRGHSVTVEDVRALELDEAMHIIADQYIFRAGFHQIADWRLRLACVDFAVHSGVTRATTVLQIIVGSEPDGIFGRETGWKVARANVVSVRERVIAERLRHLGRLITKKPSQAAFAAGWLARVGLLLETM